MGKLFSAPPPPEPPPPQEPPKQEAPMAGIAIERAPSPNTVDKATQDAAKAKAQREAQAEEEARRARRQPSTVSTSMRGLLRQATVSRRKSLLGE